MTNNYINILLLSILTFCYSCEETGADLRAENDPFPQVINVDSLVKTDFVATLDTKIDQSKNQIYCSTLLFAWDEIKTELYGKIKIKDKALKELNSATTFKSSLLKNEIETAVTITDNTIKASVEFSKLLPFSFEFIRNKYPLIFNSKLVESFGLSGHDEHEIQNQLTIIHYKNDSDFSIKISPKDQNHEIYIYLPKKTNHKNLGELVTDLNKKIEKRKKINRSDKNYWRYNFESDDRFNMPILTFNIDKNYYSLMGIKFSAKNESYHIERVYQRIAFILDEKGAIIESEVEVKASTEAVNEVLPEPKRLILDQSFFIMLKRKDTNQPYFASWVDNEELLILKE